MPGNALLGDLMMLAKVFEGVGAGGGVVLLVGEVGGFDGCLVLHAEAAIDDGEVVVRGEVVGIDGLHVLVFGAGEVVFVLLVERESKLAMGVAGLRELAA